MQFGGFTFEPSLGALSPSGLLSTLLPRPGSGEAVADSLPIELGNVASALPFASAFDRAAQVCRRFFGPSPTNEEWRRTAEEVEAALELFENRGWLRDPSRFLQPPLPLKTVRTTTARACRREFSHISFDSEYEPLVEEPGRDRWIGYTQNRTAHAWCLRHRDRRARPWVICVHGYGMGFPWVDFRAFPLLALHESLGCNVVMPVLPLHGPRRIRFTSGERFLDGDVMDTVHAEAQTIWDVRRIIDWVRRQNASGVAVMGLSLGGFNAALLAGLERDLACVIAGIPAVHLLRLALMHTHPATLERARSQGVEWSKVEEVLSVVSPLSFKARVRRERLFMFAGTRDRIIPPAHVIDLWEHWKRPRIDWYGGGHFTFGWETRIQRFVKEALEQRFACPAESRQSRAA